MEKPSNILRIIIPSLGNSAYLAETIASIGELSSQIRYHCIIVLPCGCKRPLEVDPVHTILWEPVNFHGGLYGAINIGATSPGIWTHLTYINDDDGFLGSWSNRPVEGIDIDYGIVSTKFGNCSTLSPMTVCGIPKLLPWIWQWGNPGLYQQGTIISRRIFECLRGFDETYRFTGDHAFWLMAWKAKAKFAYHNESVAYFRVRSGQLSANRSAMQLEITRATEEYSIRVGSFKSFIGFVYWRVLGASSYFTRLSKGLPARIQPGSHKNE